MGIPAELEARKVSSPIVSSEDLILDRAREQCAEEQQAML